MKKTLLVLASVLPGLVFVGVARADHANNPGAHWNRETVRLFDSVTTDWDAALNAASATWDGGLNEIQTSVKPSKSGKRTRKRCPYADKAVRVCNFEYGDSNTWNGTAGLAQYFYSIPGKHITRARIRLNDTNTQPTHRQAVTVHEIGHTLGLNHRHPADVTSCMTPSVQASQINPDTHDFEEVDQLHAHHGARVADSSDAEVSSRRVGNDEILVTWRIAAP